MKPSITSTSRAACSARSLRSVSACSGDVNDDAHAGRCSDRRRLDERRWRSGQRL